MLVRLGPLRASRESPRRAAAAAAAAALAEGGDGAARARGCRGHSEMAETVADTRRLITKPQNLNDAYGPPSNFLEIDVSNPQTVGVGRGRFTTYEIRVKVRRPPLSRNPGFAAARSLRTQVRGPEASVAAPGQPPLQRSWAACLRASPPWTVCMGTSPLALGEGAGRRGRGLISACLPSS